MMAHPNYSPSNCRVSITLSSYSNVRNYSPRSLRIRLERSRYGNYAQFACGTPGNSHYFPDRRATTQIISQISSVAVKSCDTGSFTLRIITCTCTESPILLWRVTVLRYVSRNLMRDSIIFPAVKIALGKEISMVFSRLSKICWQNIANSYI